MKDLKEIFNAIKNLPQTQRDLRQLAAASEQAQSPEMQAEIERAKMQLEQYAKTQLMLQTLLVGSVVVLGVLALRK